MKIAVLMSTYNGEKFIEDQIESIRTQKGEFEMEIWVRDDGSCDRTISILKKYEKKCKLYWYEGKNVKAAHSFMDLVTHCRGYDYYAFADQDDVWLANKLEQGINQLEKIKGVPALYCANAEIVDAKLRSMGRTVFESVPKTDLYTLSCAGGLLGCTMIFNNRLATIIQKYEIPKKIVMHDFFISELCVAIGGKIIYDPNVTMKYRQHENNVIGVSYGFLKTIKERVKDISNIMSPSICEQSSEILETYSELIESDVQEWLETVADYKDTLYNRIKLAMSRKTHYANFNLGLKNRIAILMGNR